MTTIALVLAGGPLFAAPPQQQPHNGPQIIRKPQPRQQLPVEMRHRETRQEKRRPDFHRQETRRPDFHRPEPRYSEQEYVKHGYVKDQRHHHDRYYPKRGSSVRTLPHDRRIIKYRDTSYYFSGGVWWRPYHDYYVVVRPPIGLIVNFLPYGYTTIWYGGIPYYYAADTYYVWAPEYRAYVVTEAPSDSQISVEPETPDKLFVYPREGQSDEQIALDRYECHIWARSQTDFDPTQPGGGVDSYQVESKREDYNRAMKACLEARGYSVQ